jgi:hypothetical protein
MEAAKEAVDELIRPFLAVEVRGPDLEWLVNETPDGRLWVTLVNEAGESETSDTSFLTPPCDPEGAE